MIIDAFTFFNEHDIAEFRMRYLWDSVDKFVVVEGSRTHTGKQKPFHFDSYRFDWAKEKLVYYQADIDVFDLDLSYIPETYEPEAPQWKIENRQRNAILDACKYFSDDDVLMVSDCDEIPAKHIVNFRKANALKNPAACQQQVSVYGLNYICPIDWRGTTMATLGYAREHTPQVMRDMRNRYSPFPQAGWHLTYFGGADRVREKITSFAHQELCNSETTNLTYIRKCIAVGRGIFPGGTSVVRATGKDYPSDFVKLTPKEWWL